VSGKVNAITSAAFDSLDGSALTNLNASNIAQGTMDTGRLSSTVELTDQAKTITAPRTFNAPLTLNAAVVSGTSVTASAFFGDGSGLTNLSVTADSPLDTGKIWIGDATNEAQEVTV